MAELRRSASNPSRTSATTTAWGNWRSGICSSRRSVSRRFSGCGDSPACPATPYFDGPHDPHPGDPRFIRRPPGVPEGPEGGPAPGIYSGEGAIDRNRAGKQELTQAFSMLKGTLR